MATTPPEGWLMLNGQTIANAATAWPDLWAAAPVIWRSGTSMILPNGADRSLMGATASAALGTVGGANSRAIPLGALPSHSHPMPHTHEHVHTHTIAHTHTMAHLHSIAHNHGSFNTSSPSVPHAHLVSVRTNSTPGTTGSYMAASASGTTLSAQTGNDAQSHYHSFDVPAFVGNSGASSAASTGAASVATSGGASDATTGQPSISATTATGSGAAMDMTPANLRVNWMIKAAA